VRSASKTALVAAAHRGRASDRPDAICHDIWATRLAGPEGAEYARHYDQIYAYAELWMAVRTAFIDAHTRHALRSGMRQVVILGAGLDTRAARLAQVGARFFEVDQSESQADKQRRLRTLPDYPVDAARYVTCDFEHDDFVERLTASGFRADEPAFLIWEGVTYYLTEPVVRATLRRVAEGCHPGSTLIFDFVSKKLIEGQKEDQQRIRGMVGALGEPFYFGTNDLTPIVYEEGFRHLRVVSFADACLSLTGTYDRARAFRFQAFALCSRTAPDPP